ncbi:hypothetical protein GCM10027020_21100 [Nocardioides salsibiostraticola]
MKFWPTRPPLEVAKGERVLAWAQAEAVATAEESATTTCAIGGTRDAFYLPGRVPWEQIKGADWDQESEVLRVSELGAWGQPHTVYEFTMTDPGRLLQLVRERITASVVLQRHVPITGKRGVRVVARRPPGRSAQVSWFFEYDHGIDPEDPVVARAADDALAAAQAEVGAS